jgi:hypothetical protein
MYVPGRQHLQLSRVCEKLSAEGVGGQHIFASQLYCAGDENDEQTVMIAE